MADINPGLNNPSVTATNPSVGTNNTTAPTSSTQIGIEDSGGKLQPVSLSNPVPVTSGADLTTSGSLTAPSQSVILALSGQNTVGLQVTGSFTGSLAVQLSEDGGTTYNPTTAIQVSNGTILTSITGSTLAQVNVTGMSHIKILANSLSAGTATVNIRANNGVAAIMLDNPLPTGTNTIGAVNQGTNPWVTQESTTLPTYTTPPDSVAVDTSTSGDNTIVAAPGANKTIYVYAWNLSFNGTVNAKFTSGAAGTNKSGTIYGVANSGGGNSVRPPYYLFKCAVNTALVLNLSGAVAVGGSVSYFVI